MTIVTEQMYERVNAMRRRYQTTLELIADGDNVVRADVLARVALDQLPIGAVLDVNNRVGAPSPEQDQIDCLIHNAIRLYELMDSGHILAQAQPSAPEGGYLTVADFLDSVAGLIKIQQQQEDDQS